MYSGLMIFASGLRPIRGPTTSPMVKPTWSPTTAAAKQPTSTSARFSDPWLANQPGREHQRVAGEEEADEQPGLGEDDEHEPDLAVGAERVEDRLRVEAERQGDGQVHHRHRVVSSAATSSGEAW